MRTLTLLLTIILVGLTANCQQHSWGIKQQSYDSVVFLLNNSRFDIDYYYIKSAKTKYKFDSLQIKTDIDNIFYQTRIKQLEDSLKNGYYTFNPDTISLQIDTLYLKITDKNFKFSIDKKGEYAKISMYDKLSHRIYLTKLENDLDLWVQDSLFTRQSEHLDLR